MTLTLWPIFEETMSSGMYPNIYVASFGDFLSPPRTSIRAQVLGSRVNRGAGYVLQIPVRFIFQGHAKGVEWARKKISDAEKKVEARYEKSLKNAV